MNNEVEQRTWNLMRGLMLAIDPDREGWCIDAGVGRFDFYFEWMRDLGYEVIAIDPIWSTEMSDALKRCGNRAICGVLSNTHDYPVPLYRSDSRELYSTELFWGNMEHIQTTESWTIEAAVATFNPTDKIIHLTALKLDIEGAEPTVIATFPDLPTNLLPAIISFEWGGERPMSDNIGAWSHEQQYRVQTAFNTLKSLGYDRGLIIGQGDGLIMRPIERGTPPPFENADNWGNAVLTRRNVSMETIWQMANTNA